MDTKEHQGTLLVDRVARVSQLQILIMIIVEETVQIQMDRIGMILAVGHVLLMTSR